MTPRFITLEGGEGAGKTTQMQALEEYLQSLNPVVRTREPGGTPEAMLIRNLLVEGDTNWDPVTETMLFAAARREHLLNKILPALQANTHVVCDRFVTSTLALQGARGVGADVILQMHDLFCWGKFPDLTVILDIDPEIGLERAFLRESGKGQKEDRFERMGLEFHRRVRANFLSQAAQDPDRFLVVDANAPPEQVTIRLLTAVADWLARSHLRETYKGEPALENSLGQTV